jgi:lipoprotein NlpI
MAPKGEGTPIHNTPIDPEAEAERCSRNAAGLAEAGEIQHAIDEYGKAIEMNPDHEPYRLARAELHDLAGDYAAAMTDLNHAVELEPEDPVAWRRRALSYYAHGQYRTAMRNLNKAVALDPNSPYDYFHRGRTILGLQGKPFQIAADDFTRALERMPGLPGYEHAALWLHVARGRMGRDGSKDLADFWHTRVTTRGTWLIPAIKMYVGKITPEQCLAASADDDPKIHDHQMCNAHLHVGEYYLIHGDKLKAKAHFEQAVSIGAPRAAECARYAAAKAAEQSPDPDESADLARRAGFSEYYAALAELDFMAKTEALKQKRMSWGWSHEALAEVEAKGEQRIE